VKGKGSSVVLPKRRAELADEEEEGEKKGEKGKMGAPPVAGRLRGSTTERGERGKGGGQKRGGRGVFQLLTSTRNCARLPLT